MHDGVNYIIILKSIKYLHRNDQKIYDITRVPAAEILPWELPSLIRELAPES